jgi:HTH-type transcriptional regulator / antitoxin HigA
MTKKQFTYNPDYSIHPGEYIQEFLETFGMKQTELALRLGITTKHLNNIVKGKVSVSPETANSLEMVFGKSAKYWLSIQANFDIFERVKKIEAEYAENKTEYDQWLQIFDYEDLVKREYIKEKVCGNTIANKVHNLLNFFSCSDLACWKTLYYETIPFSCRSTGLSTAKVGNTTAWIRMGQILAQNGSVDLPSYSKKSFTMVLQEFRTISIAPEENFAVRMVELCRSAGVVLAFLQEIPRASISGAAFWINGGNVPCMILNLRYKKNDHFWFSIFHEAAHIIAEDKRKIYYEFKDNSEVDIETKADEFAKNFLIPYSDYQSFIEKEDFRTESITNFANSIGIHPGIVVGRLQHDGQINWNTNNSLKSTFKWG